MPNNPQEALMQKRAKLPARHELKYFIHPAEVEALRVQLLLWEGGDTFRPAAEILFSDNFPLAFEAEDAPLVCSVLLRALEQA